MPGIITLSRMHQQQEVRTLKDDWTGVTDAAERRKLQNRLNQRIYRKRRAAKANVHPRSPSLVDSESLSAKAFTPQSEDVNSNLSSSSPEVETRVSTSIFLDTIAQDFQHLSHIRSKSIHDLSLLQLRDVMHQFELHSRRDYLHGSPRTDQLLTLIQFNVFRALYSNTMTLGFGITWIEDENAISPFLSMPGPTCVGSTEDSPQTPSPSTPLSLRPTWLQRIVPHHPWIDLFPFPTMRDNLLLAEVGDGYDEYGLCNDLVDFCDVTNDNTGLIVWKEPWDPSGWEVSEPFLRKWGWVVRGCRELMVSTNFWREKRGEERLVWEV